MPPSHDPSAGKRAANVSLNSGLLNEAKALKVNVSAACEAGLAEEVRKARVRRWQEDNREAIEAYNRRVEKWGTAAEHLLGLRDGAV